MSDMAGYLPDFFAPPPSSLFALAQGHGPADSAAKGKAATASQASLAAGAGGKAGLTAPEDAAALRQPPQQQHHGMQATHQLLYRAAGASPPTAAATAGSAAGSMSPAIDAAKGSGNVQAVELV